MLSPVRRFMAALLLAACAGPQGPDKTTLTVGRAADAISLDPARISDVESWEVCEQIFDHLVRYRAGTTEVEPDLATSWDVADEGTSWTFHLRRGVRFHDGTPMNADAVVFSLERQRDPNHPNHEPDFVYWGNNYGNIQSIERVDEYTVHISVDRPYAPFLAYLAMVPVAIVSPTAVKKWGHEFSRHPVGTGPFRFVEWVRGERISLAANPDSWEGRPKISHLVYRTVGGERDRLVAIESGSVDVAYQIAPKDIGYVGLHPDLQVLRTAAHNVAFIAMNTQRAPFDDVRVRRAVNYAINKTLIVKLLYQSLAVPAYGPLPPNMWGYDPALPRYDYDPEHARALLREAGYSKARRPRFYVMSTPRPYVGAPERVGRVIARNLHDVGMDVDLIVSPLARHFDATVRGEHDLCLRGWTGDNGDPDNFLYTLLDRDTLTTRRGSNVAFYRNPEVHGLLMWAQETFDRSEREQLYRKAQHIIARDAPWAPLAHAEVAVVVRADVHGVSVDPSSMVYYRNAWRNP
jgi:peptide/nickel transport system substrate-binding protein